MTIWPCFFLEVLSKPETSGSDKRASLSTETGDSELLQPKSNANVRKTNNVFTTNLLIGIAPSIEVIVKVMR
jgi:hypothetical protein